MKARDPELKALIEQGWVQFVPPLRLSIHTIGWKQEKTGKHVVSEENYLGGGDGSKELDV